MRDFRRILDRGNRASIHGVIGQMKFVTDVQQKKTSGRARKTSKMQMN